MLGPLVRALTARERRVLELRFFQGASQAEIGEELGVTQTQVSRLLSGIFRRLREQVLDASQGTGVGPTDLTSAA